METTWEIIGQDGQFLVVEFTRGGNSIRLQVLPPDMPPPDSEETFDEALARTIRAHEPRPEQFEQMSHPDLSDLIGSRGSTSTPSALPTGGQ